MAMARKSLRRKLTNILESVAVFPFLCACMCCPCIDSEWLLYGRRPTFRKKHRPAELRQSRPSDAECCLAERDLWRKEARERGWLPAIQPRADAPQKSIKSRRGLSPNCEQEVGTSIVVAGGKSPFLELPFELREQIYLQYIALWGQQRITPFRVRIDEAEQLPDEYYYKPIPPHEPPLNRVSRQVREESIPLFYSRHTFPFIIHTFPGARSTAVHWYHELDQAKLRRIANWEIYVCFESVGSMFTLVRKADAQSWILKLDAKSNAYRLGGAVVYGHGPSTVTSLFMPGWHAVEAHLREALDSMIVTQSVEDLTADSLDRLIPPLWTDLFR